MANPTDWKTEEYHGYHMHVCARPRPVENDALPGHGDQWDFTVRITRAGEGPDAAEQESGQSDPGIFYSTQAVAENMGFLKGRELIEGRAASRTAEAPESGRVL